MQWSGVTNAPNTFIVTAETPFKFMKKEHKAGIILINDKAGLFSNTTFALQYAYGLKMNDHTLSFGIRLGASTQGFDAGKIVIPDTPDHNSSDPSLPSSDVSEMAFDAGFGVHYKYNNLSLGFSDRKSVV